MTKNFFLLCLFSKIACKKKNKKKTFFFVKLQGTQIESKKQIQTNCTSTSTFFFSRLWKKNRKKFLLNASKLFTRQARSLCSFCFCCYVYQGMWNLNQWSKTRRKNKRQSFTEIVETANSKGENGPVCFGVVTLLSRVCFWEATIFVFFILNKDFNYFLFEEHLFILNICTFFFAL